MKTLLSKLVVMAATLCALPLAAQVSPGGDFYFSVAYPVSYTYDKGAETPLEKCTEPLIANEVFRILLVRDSRPGLTQTSTPSVTIDAAGQIILGENALGAAWQSLGIGSSYKTYITVNASLPGVPGQIMQYGGSAAASLYGFSAYFTVNVPGTGGYLYCYLVALDTRTGLGVCAGTPTHVARYAMTLCHYSSGQSNIPTGTTGSSRRNFVVTGTTGSTSSGQTLAWPGYDLGWQSASAIESLAVTQNGTQVTLTGDELAAYLKPSVNSLTQGIEDGQSVLNLAVTAPDVQYYTLYTKAKLSDAEWTKFEDYVKTLDNVDGKYYTRFRIDGESPLKIPVLTDETSRFYQLRGE